MSEFPLDTNEYSLNKLLISITLPFRMRIPPCSHSSLFFQGSFSVFLKYFVQPPSPSTRAVVQPVQSWRSRPWRCDRWRSFCPSFLEQKRWSEEWHTWWKGPWSVFFQLSLRIVFRCNLFPKFIEDPICITVLGCIPNCSCTHEWWQYSQLEVQSIPSCQAVWKFHAESEE